MCQRPSRACHPDGRISGRSRPACPRSGRLKPARSDTASERSAQRPWPEERTEKRQALSVVGACCAAAADVSSGLAHDEALDGVLLRARLESRDEVIAICRVVRDFPGSKLEFIPAVGHFDAEVFVLMGEMRAASVLPLNWILFLVYGENWDYV